jgi:hypothetical protein
MHLVFAREAGVRVKIGDAEREFIGRDITPWAATERLFQELPREMRRRFDDIHARWWEEMKASGASAEKFRRWTCFTVVGAGAAERVEADLTDWSSGVPLAGMTELLNRYAGDGWSIVHVSEDRGLYGGEDVPNESYPSRIRYLLSKDA